MIDSHPMAREHLELQASDGKLPGEKVVKLVGVLNAETVYILQLWIRENDPETLILDMTGVRYVDSSGLGTLIGAYVSFEKRFKHVLLAGLNDRIWTLFHTCKIEELFTRYPSVADAEHTLAMPA